MRKRSIYHIAPAHDGWRVVARDAKRALSVHRSKKEAVKEGWRLAQSNKPSHLIVHRRDGSVELERLYVADRKRAAD